MSENRREEREREQEKAKVNIWRISNVEQREKEIQELQKTDLKEVINKELQRIFGRPNIQQGNDALELVLWKMSLKGK